jgi:hypothetical protein
VGLRALALHQRLDARLLHLGRRRSGWIVALEVAMTSPSTTPPDELTAIEEAAKVSAGLDDALNTIAEIWRRTDGDAARARAMRALKAVIQAKQTMIYADAFVCAKTRGERKAKYERLLVACCQRVGRDARRTP